MTLSLIRAETKKIFDYFNKDSYSTIKREKNGLKISKIETAYTTLN